MTAHGSIYRVAGALTITRAATTQREIDALPDPLTIDLSRNRAHGHGRRVDRLSHRPRPRRQGRRRQPRRGQPAQAGRRIRRARRGSIPSEPASFIRVLDELGEWVAETGRTLLGLLGFFGATLIGFANVIRRPRRFRVNAVVQRFDVVGVRALGIIGLMSFLIGIVIAQQGAVQLAQFGAEIYTINLIGRITVRELGVLMTAIMVAGRSGSAFAAQIGTMKITEEIDAMRTIGVSPIEALVIPRMIAAVLMMPLLAFWAMLTGADRRRHVRLAVDLGIPPLTYIQRLQEVIPMTDLWVGLIKAPVFGFIIALAGCFQGMLVQGNSEEVGIAHDHRGRPGDLPGDRARRGLRGLLQLDRLEMTTRRTAIRSSRSAGCATASASRSSTTTSTSPSAAARSSAWSAARAPASRC